MLIQMLNNFYNYIPLLCSGSGSLILCYIPLPTLPLGQSPAGFLVAASRKKKQTHGVALPALLCTCPPCSAPFIAYRSALPFSALPCPCPCPCNTPALPCPGLGCPVLPCPALSFPALPLVLLMTLLMTKVDDVTFLKCKF